MHSPLDDSTSTELEAERRIALVRAIELVAILEHTLVLHLNVIAALGRARALHRLGDLDAELGCRECGGGQGREGDGNGSEAHFEFGSSVLLCVRSRCCDEKG